MDDKDEKHERTLTGRVIDTDAEWKRLMQTAHDQMQTVTGRMTDAERKALKQARFLEAYGTPNPVMVIHTPNGVDDGQRIRDLFNAHKDGPWHLIQMDWDNETGQSAVISNEVPLGEPGVCVLGMDTPEYWGISREEWAKRIETMDFGDLEARITAIRPEGPPIRILDGQARGLEMPHDLEYVRHRDVAIMGGARSTLGLALAVAALGIGVTTPSVLELNQPWETGWDWSREPQPINPNDFRDLGHPNERRRFGNNKSLTNMVKARLAKKLAKKSRQRNKK